MAQLEALNIQLTADVKGLSTNLKVGEDGVIKFAKTVGQLEGQLKSFQTGLKNASNPESIARLNRAIEATGDKIKAIKGFGNDAGDGLKKVKKESEGAGDGLTKFSKGSGQATQATVNLSRVLQDAPFGFIGIANNLNPLLESFQRLGKESGGLKGALSALGSSMLGAGGIGLALSAFQFFALGGVDAIKKMFGALGDNKAVAEARKEMDEFNKSLKSAESGALATGLKLQSFVEIAKNGQLPLSQRNEALKQANIILGEHGTKLTLANVATKAITEQTKLYTEALIAQAVAAKFADRIADITVQQATVRERSIKESGELQKKTLEETQKLTERYSRSGKKVDISRIIDVGAEKKKLTETLQESTSLSIQLQGLKNLFAESTNSATKLFGILGTNKDDKTGGTAKKIQSEADKIAEIVKKLYADIDGLKAANKEGLLSGAALDEKSIDAYKNAIQNIGEIDVNSKIIPKLGLEVNPIVIRDLFRKEGERLANQKPYEVEVPVDIKPKANGESGFDFSEALAEALRKAGKTVSDGMQPFRDIIFQTVADSFSGIGDAIATSITGGGNFGAALFGGLFQTLGAGLQAYGKKIIETSTLLKALQEALKLSNFGGSLILGIGLVALGGITKNLGGQLKLADGGFVSGKGTSRSDSIPAMLSNGEYVINAAAVRKFGLNNLDKINSLQGFAAGGVIGVPQPYAVPNNNVNISNSGIVVAIEGEFKMRNDVLALAVKKGNKTVSINS